MLLELKLKPGQKKICHKPLLLETSGLILGLQYDPVHVRSALNYKPLQGDLFVATFPKSGTTWTQTICYMMYNQGTTPTPADVMINVPFLEMFGEEGVINILPPRIIKTHLPVDVCPFSMDAKYIVVLRNPKDVCVSYFHHMKSFPVYNFQDGTLQEYFDLFVSGKGECGDYFDHLKGWFAQRRRSNVLILFYENMKLFPTESIKKIGKFLGLEEMLSNGNNKLLEQIVKNTDFHVMAQAYNKFDLLENEAFKTDNIPTGLQHLIQVSINAGQEKKPSNSFLRKGIIGDWANHLTVAMNQRMNHLIQEKLQPVEDYVDILSLWKECKIID